MTTTNVTMTTKSVAELIEAERTARDAVARAMATERDAEAAFGAHGTDTEWKRVSAARDARARAELAARHVTAALEAARVREAEEARTADLARLDQLRAATRLTAWRTHAAPIAAEVGRLASALASKLGALEAISAELNAQRHEAAQIAARCGVPAELDPEIDGARVRAEVALALGTAGVTTGLGPWLTPAPASIGERVNWLTRIFEQPLCIESERDFPAEDRITTLLEGTYTARLQTLSRERTASLEAALARQAEQAQRDAEERARLARLGVS